MSITRKMLKGMGLNQDQEDTIIEAHTETVDALKEQADKYKSDAEELSSVRAELKKAQDDLEASGDDGYKEKYESLKSEYEQYKADQTEKETHNAKESAYREMLQEAGVSEKRIPTVLKVSDIDGVELDKEGKIKGASKLSESIKEEWADFIPEVTAKGQDTPNPPANNGSTSMTKDDIVKIKDPVARQNAIADNISLFEGKED